ncbi:MAG: CMD domain protein [Thermomicrobiales bacterium]
MVSAPETTRSPIDTNVQDVINHLAGIAADSPLGQLRAQRPEVLRHAQGSYETLLEPDDPAGVSRFEREAIALRVAVLTPDPALAEWHRDRLRDLGTSNDEIAAVTRVPDVDDAVLPARTAAILRHTDLLTWEPGAAGDAELAALKAHDLQTRDIVTISQLIAFVSFQVRVLAGLRALGEEA